jgi:SAM-dependent methyltransferase
MHRSSLMKLQAFLAVYAAEDVTDRRVLDVGSATYKGHVTYRASCEKLGLKYVGLDMQAGPNVDIITARPCVYEEIGDEEFDYVISGQAFEHNPYFWISFCEMARVLKQGGHMLVIAPSAGTVHRFPFDCWRYYPDSWAALCALSGLERVETIFEPTENRHVEGALKWRDSAVVARKNPFASDEERSAFYANLAEIIAPFRRSNFELTAADPNKGPAFEEYQRMVAALPAVPVAPKVPAAPVAPLAPVAPATSVTR